jgi:hypothetical protein
MSVKAETPPPDLDLLPADATLDAEAIAAILACSTKTVHRQSGSGGLPGGMRIGQLRRWRVGNFRDWLRRQAEKPSTGGST